MSVNSLQQDKLSFSKLFNEGRPLMSVRFSQEYKCNYSGTQLIDIIGDIFENFVIPKIL